MDNPEAKLMLQARRPNGRDDAQSAFAEALALVESDPELKAWWEAQQAQEDHADHDDGPRRPGGPEHHPRPGRRDGDGLGLAPPGTAGTALARTDVPLASCGQRDIPVHEHWYSG